ncbi:hypothetical protein RYX36_021789 [Vicia faba]
MGEINSAYILSTEHRPNFSSFIKVDKIPIIDLSQTSQENLISEIGKACEEWGFFHIINHGVSSDLINKVANETKKETIAEYGGKLEKLSFKLLELISLSLGLSGDKFFDCFENQLSLVRLNYYPPCPSPDLALGIGPHKDPCVLTIVAQDDTGGLQVKNNSVGGWVPIEPIPGALVVNVGDVFQVWSNDKYDSAIHRATVNSQKERYSYPFFFFPGHDVMVKPAEELVSEQGPAKYKPYNFGKYYSNRTRHDFNKEKVAGKEIHDFKILD